MTKGRKYQRPPVRLTAGDAVPKERIKQVRIKVLAGHAPRETPIEGAGTALQCECGWSLSWARNRASAIAAHEGHLRSVEFERVANERPAGPITSRGKRRTGREGAL